MIRGYGEWPIKGWRNGNAGLGLAMRKVEGERIDAEKKRKEKGVLKRTEKKAKKSYETSKQLHSG